ncbi:hypothetical protein [Maribacter cobaltidurans]|uniref:Uncharacterized protein n=1 Tax=Maribacter cobaltidurans TaxID=1178778 RepID=A0A223V4R2_9FLAO|nr:hypothetical protein [Maribacter cobaltidurans]ASV30197.1 hypothetical protein CJ263_08180 [Maribacter cobaltidurans]GGD76570.1 hypothetical protein GCM10011412_12910 [Maribacter cobaltidurans]
MADNQSTNGQNTSDEIDLGQLFQFIGRGFNAIFRFILRIFLYLKRNILILIGLFVLGVAIGYGLNKIISKKLKTEVIVKPQLESKNYLYDVIEEIQSNISSQDTLFFKSIGIDEINFSGLEVTISAVDYNKESTEGEMKYLELLQSFENTGAITDIVRAELQNKSSFNHRITFFYKNRDTGKIFAEKIMEYINSNPYLERLIEISRTNAKSRIEENQILLKQVDEIISNYTNGLGTKGTNSISDRIVLDNQEQVNIADLFEYKNLLIRDTEAKKIELVQQTEPINVINFGKPQVVRKSFFGKNLVLLPLIFIGVFFLISFLIFLNNKAKEISSH